MKEFSFTELLRDGVEFCEWCVHPCRDDDKYEMLVICIAIQKESMAVCCKVYSILGVNASAFMKDVFEMLEKLPENLQPGREPEVTDNTVFKTQRGLPGAGCSRIFHIAQFIEQSYLNLSFNED